MHYRGVWDQRQLGIQLKPAGALISQIFTKFPIAKIEGVRVLFRLGPI